MKKNLYKWRSRGIFLPFLLFIILLTACSPPKITVEFPPEKSCQQDSDCVPAQCFHATAAVNQESAPNCEGVFGTQECKPGTLDCGQGKITCQAGECVVIIFEGE